MKNYKDFTVSTLPPPPPSLTFSWGCLWVVVACLSLFFCATSSATDFTFNGSNPVQKITDPSDNIIRDISIDAMEYGWYQSITFDITGTVKHTGWIYALWDGEQDDWLGDLTKKGSGTLEGRTCFLMGDLVVDEGVIEVYHTHYLWNPQKTINNATISIKVDNALICELGGTSTSAELQTNGYAINISGTSTYAGKLTGNGNVYISGSLTMSGNAWENTGNVTLDRQALTLEKGGTLYNLSSEKYTSTVTSNENLTLHNTGESKFTGSITAIGKEITKSGDGTLKIDASGSNKITVEKFIQTAGELDINGYLDGKLDLEGGTFSPGNSIGDVTVSDTTSISETATMLFEITGLDTYDTLTTESFTVGENVSRFIKLAVTGDSYNDGDSMAIITVTGADQTISDFSSDWLNEESTANWNLALSPDKKSIYALFGSPSPETGVPEPSTWALLILGCAGLMWYRKRERR